MTPQTLRKIAEAIEKARKTPFHPTKVERAYGGDINRCFIVADSHQGFFVKTNAGPLGPMLRAEYGNLIKMRAAQAVRVPAPITFGTTTDCAFLVIEYHTLKSNGDANSLAAGLCRLHRQTSPDGRFGWDEDNYLGTSPQHNRWHYDWPSFWWQQRLSPQLGMAYRNGFEHKLKDAAQALETRFPGFWRSYRPVPSLLHGDLWGGNAAYLESGEAIVYDPACYYGDRETDLAMTELFGGFTPEFYREYNRLWPLDEGYERRKPLYNLYHLLNHLNLFGGAYLSQCESVLKQLTR